MAIEFTDKEELEMTERGEVPLGLLVYCPETKHYRLHTIGNLPDVSLISALLQENGMNFDQKNSNVRKKRK